MMNPKYYKIIFFGGLGAVFVFFVTFRFINKSIENRLEVQLEHIEEEIVHAQAAQISAQAKKKEKRPLSPTDLTPYLIVEHSKTVPFKNQQYWDNMMKDSLERSDVAHRIRQGGTFKADTGSAGQMKKQMKKIEGRISEYKLKIQNDPNDGYAQQKLQDLYLLKATVKALEDALK